MAAREFIRRTVPSRHLFTDDPKCDPCWIRVQDESDAYPASGLVTIAEEDITSFSDTAKVTSVHAAIDLDDRQALFVWRALGVYLRSRRIMTDVNDTFCTTCKLPIPSYLTDGLPAPFCVCMKKLPKGELPADPVECGERGAFPAPLQGAREMDIRSQQSGGGQGGQGGGGTSKPMTPQNPPGQSGTKPGQTPGTNPQQGGQGGQGQGGQSGPKK